MIETIKTNKTFQYRLKPTPEQEQLLQQYAGGCRFIYNWGLDYYKKFLEKKPEENQVDEKKEKEKFPTAFDLINQMVKLKRVPETEWVKNIPAQALQQAIMDLNFSMKAFFRERKRNPLYGFPRFKARGQRDSFRIPAGIKVDGKRVFCPKIGWLQFFDRYDRKPEGIIKQATFKFNGIHWYVAIVCEIEIAKWVDIANVKDSKEANTADNTKAKTANKISQEVIGKDRFIKIGDESIQVPAFMDDELAAYKRLSRRLSRCTKDSKRYAKAHKKLLAFHAMIANRRKDFLHKITTSIIKKSQSIILQSDDIKKKIQGNRWHQNRLLYDLAWGMLEAQLKYKALWHGKELIVEK